jgi:DNA-binding transcriptional regulator YiaG
VLLDVKTATQAQGGRRGPYRSKRPSLIGRLRRGLALTQAEAAARCAVSLRTYQRAEAGDCVPRDVVRGIERGLGMRW